MISCRDVSKLLLSDALEGEPWHRRLEVRMHLAMCRMCSRLERQIRQMSAGVRETMAQREADADFEARLLRKMKDSL